LNEDSKRQKKKKNSNSNITNMKLKKLVQAGQVHGQKINKNTHRNKCRDK